MAGEGRAVGWAKGKPVQAIAVIAGVGLVVGLLVGLAAGYKIEQQRVKHDLTKLKTKASGGTSSTKHTGHAGSKTASRTIQVERVGVVTATGTGTITVTTKNHGPLTLHLNNGTRIDDAGNGTTADVKAGSRVLIAKGAHAVIVLPTGTKIGRKVTKVSNGVATVTAIKGVAPLQLSNVQTVYTTSKATASGIKSGAHIVAWYHRAKGNPAALEIIVLPSGSAFG